MAKKPSATASQQRKPRLLWANPFCLMDTSSGASMTVRQMLLQLVASGYEVQVLGATIFDNPKGMGQLKEQFPDLSAHLHQLIEAEDGPLTHQLVVSYSHNRNHVTTHEEGLWYSQYLYLLDSFKPDVVWFYGGQTLDMLIADEARDRGIAVAFYLANGNYKSPRWCRDVDLILTDSQATAEMYRKEVGFAAKPVGKFIDPSLFVAEHHERKRLLFVNPSWQKGASVFVQLAEKLERERPEIELEVVEARADWRAVLRETTQRMGKQRSTLKNVVVTPNTHDMRGPYSRARVLIAPSLWWESSGRVLAEAMLNGIPALITNRGGMPEMIDDAGIVFDLPETCYEEPYQHLLSDEELQPLYEAVLAFCDDEALYQDYAERAQRVGEQKHHIDRATERLLTALTPLVRPRAGNKDFSITQRKRHRQRLASKATKPEFKTDNSLQNLVISQQGGGTTSPETPISGLWLSDDFTWQLKSKVVVLDNRAKLIKSGLADQMAATSAFGIVAFDPASEVKNVQQYEGSEYIQVFQHALLGDGQPATLNACVDPELTGTLKPLPAEQLPEHRRLGAQPIAELPINTVALDSISGLDSLDWLILDELSDAMAVLEHGKESLKETLLIQARVAFQPTHERQPSMAELQHWASRNGFRFYRFHDFQHHSHLPETLKERTNCATEQESADVLFLPSHERMTALTEEQKTKLAFVLSTVFRAHDMAFDLMATVSQEQAVELLEAQGFLEKQRDGLSTSSKTNNAPPHITRKVDIDKEGERRAHSEGASFTGVSKKYKNAIIMLSFGERPWVKGTSEAANRYAKKIGADFFLIQEPPSDNELMLPELNDLVGRVNKDVYAYKLYFPWKYLTQHGYERVLLIDDSAVININSPCVFSEVPKGFSGYAWSQPEEALISLAGINAWLRNKNSTTSLAIDAAENFYRSTLFGSVDISKISNPVNIQTDDGILELDIQKYANTAVMIFDHSCVRAISPEEIYSASELLYSAQPNQTLWWYLLSKNKAPVYKLNPSWNWLLGWELGTNNRREMTDIRICKKHSDAFISHVTSAYKNREALISQLYESQIGTDQPSLIRANNPSLFKELFKSIISTSRLVHIIQVGANDGKINDPIYDIVMRKKKKTKIALVEPQTNLITYLSKNYRSHPNAEIVNCAIGQSGMLPLYRVSPEYYSVFIPRYLLDSPQYRVPSGFSSFNKDHVIKHVLGNLPEGITAEEVIEKIEVPCVQLKELIQQLGWKNGVDVLQIDTEGMDDIVIYASSMEKYKPAIVNFEHSHLSTNAYNEVCRYLADMGYSVCRYSASDTLATLLNVDKILG